MKKTFTLFFTVLIALVFSGCAPFFIRNGEPVIISNSQRTEDNMRNKTTNNASITIDSINSRLTDGIIYDISRDGDYLLVGTQIESPPNESGDPAEIFYNLSTYDFQTNQPNPLLYSNKNQANGLIDFKNKGYYYLEFNQEGNTQEFSARLLWSDLEGDTTKNISSSSESISPGFSMINDDLVIYGNQQGEIKLVNHQRTLFNPDGTSHAYKMTKRLPIARIDFLEKHDIAFFMAYNQDNRSYDLYYVYLTKENPEPVLIQKNVYHFDLSNQKNSLLYSTAGEKDTQKLVRLDILNNTRTTLREGYIGLFSFNRTGDKIIYSEKSDSASNSQNLWFMDVDGNSQTQLASNLNITGDRIVFHPYKTTVYFTVFTLSEENSDNRRISYSVYMIDYSTSTD
ncbi:hypothetical protein [Alkalibacter saccharofermentans]|uniref:TolB protein n=1 Tax=Alkalibacter saccharofermentans DSM 14828 TaxID=1120975 RepID=A0A1M4VV86_9FIRM|nr:hypothetical protein [Alkalibacter saccharofermentans]SHE72879.1 hypothetical protein SAMN02746064_01071 [Alkalibacter saccharofermentans DSM 14828]